ncbi:vacuolar membrane protein-domain-containing protein [Gloeopeniophorella convolvens]|nr:vacuolar membrane protein-domain-containing protein [Gloeopeniophorella convolvens]
MSSPPPGNPDGGIFDDYPVDRKSCKLLGTTALIVQALMGVLVIASLLFKRHREKPMRPWRIWLFDVSKQIVGQMFVHGVNVLISDVGSTRSSGNACVFYFLNILIDTTLGVGVIYFILHLLTWLFTDKLQLKGFQSGQYGTPPAVGYWLRQAAVYVVALTSMKLLVVALLASWHGILDIGAWMLSWLGTSEAAQVIFTMGLFPIFMNIVQFWLIDSIVKAGGTGVALPADSPRTSLDRQPLFAPNDDLDDDDESDDALGAPLPKRDIEAGLPHAHLSRRSTDSTHTYPPSAPGSPTPAPAPAPVRSSSMSPTRLPARRVRSPPAPLLPRSPMVPALNSPDAQRDKDEWAAWDGEGDADEWAERVGEEEWTGRRAAAAQGTVDSVWRES